MRKWLATRLAELSNRGDGEKKNKLGLAKHLGLQPSRVTEMIAGTRKIDSREVRPLAEYLEWPESKIMNLISPGPLRPTPLGSIMVRGSVEAGHWREAVMWAEADWKPAPISPDARYPEARQFGLEVIGPSMDRLYPEGTILVCVSLQDYRGDPTPGQKVIVQRRALDGFEATVKELGQDDAGQYWLWPRSNHPEYQQPWPIPKPNDFGENDDIQIVAVVVGSYRPE